MLRVPLLHRRRAVPRAGEVYLGTDSSGMRSTEEVMGGGVRVLRRYRPDGSLMEESWRKGNLVHREGAPAGRVWFANGNPHFEEWVLHGETSRPDGPAQLGWTESGKREYEDWYHSGIPERLDGPASIHCDARGAVSTARWSVLGSLVRHEHAGVARALTRTTPGEALDAVRWSVFGPLLDQGVSVDEVIGAIEVGVLTPAGVTAFLEGTPVEWIRAWETGEVTES